MDDLPSSESFQLLEVAQYEVALVTGAGAQQAASGFEMVSNGAMSLP